MENLQITWETLLAIAGGVVLLMNAAKMLVQLLDPFKELKAKQEEQEKFLDNDKKRLDKLESEIEEIHNSIAIVGLALSEMINHELTGNDVEELKKRQKQLDEYFYEGRRK